MDLIRQLLGDPSEEESAAVALLKDVGGETTQDRNGNIVAVFFIGSTVRDSDLAPLCHLPALRTLTFFSCPNITDGALEHLAALKALASLTLKYTSVTDAGLLRLEGLTALQRLSVDSPGVSAKALEELRRRCPTVKIDGTKTHLESGARCTVLRVPHRY